MSVVRPFSVLSKDETGRFLSKAEILGMGVFSPLSIVLGPKHETPRKSPENSGTMPSKFVYALSCSICHLLRPILPGGPDLFLPIWTYFVSQ